MDSSQAGQIVSVQLCVGHREPMRVVDSAKAIAGFGIEGDAHATFEEDRAARQVLLMDQETLSSLDLSASEVRENVTTTGIELSMLTEGQRLALGDEVLVDVTGLCEPCGRMDEIRPGLRRELEGKRGVLAAVVQSGAFSVGDTVRVVTGVQS